jgi:transglutaminase-like putative cysteine protease
MNYRVTHITLYEYAAPVTVSHHTARLHPRHDTRQQCLNFALQITPNPALRTSRADFFGNSVSAFSIQEIHNRLEVRATSEVEVRPASPPSLKKSPAWEQVAELFRESAPVELLEAYQFTFESPNIRCSAELAEFAGPCFEPGRPLLEGARELTRMIHAEFKYDSKATTVSTPLEDVLAKRRGVCQDFAQVAIAGLRSLGLPARYVSGYVRTHPPAGEQALIGADASHAWFSVFTPGVGWVDFDPTNDLMPGIEHITLGYGRDFSDLSPVSGMIVGGGDHVVKVAVDVKPVGDNPAGRESL